MPVTLVTEEGSLPFWRAKALPYKKKMGVGPDVGAGLLCPRGYAPTAALDKRREKWIAASLRSSQWRPAAKISHQRARWIRNDRAGLRHCHPEPSAYTGEGSWHSRK